MAFEKFSYDPLTGVTTYFDYDDDTGTAIFRREMDVQPLLDHLANVRAAAPKSYINTPDEQWQLQAQIDPMTMVELMKKGYDFNNPDHATPIAREIELNYPYLKATDKKIWRPT